jgi:putative phage-type endonuclease
MLSQEQREARRKWLGSSDAAAIVGCNPYKTAFDVFLEKTYQTEDIKDNEAIKIGNVLEPSILQWGAAELGVEIELNPAMRTHANGFMAFNPDALVKGQPEILEAKTAGVLWSYLRDWGEIGTDEVPEQYLIQCQHGMGVMGPEFKRCHVPALMGGVGLRMYHVERDDELIGSLEVLEEKFWREHVLKGLPPDDSIPTEDVIKRIRRVPKKTVQVESSLILNWEQAKELAREAQKKADEAKALLLAALGDAEAGESEAGAVTYFEQTRKAYEVKESTYRVLRAKTKGAKNAA